MYDINENIKSPIIRWRPFNLNLLESLEVLFSEKQCYAKALFFLRSFLDFVKNKIMKKVLFYTY